MNSRVSFLSWLWSDWGKSTFFTKLGVPRIVTYLLAYLVAPYLFFWLTARYVSGANWEMFRRIMRDPLFLSAYAIFFVALVIQEFLQFKYDLTTYPRRERSRMLRKNWRDPWVIALWVSLGCTFLLLLLASWKFPFPAVAR